MQILEEKKAKGSSTLTIEVSVDELQPYRAKAAIEISKARAIAGFRPGAAPLEIIERTVGAHAVLEAALERAIPHFVAQAVKENDMQTTGMPKIEILTLAPGNPLKFKAEFALVPPVTLGKFSDIKVKPVTTPITDEAVTKVLTDLQKMQSKEIASTDPITDMSKVVVDMQMTLDNVPLEGGETKSHAIYFSEDYYIPGLKEKLLGAKAGETMAFKLPFPKEHYNKNLAGKNVDFNVNIKEVFRVEPPALDEAFAAKLGQKSIEDMKALIRTNLTDDAKRKDDQAFELQVLESAMKASKYGDIPEVLIAQEVQRMMREFEARLDQDGGTLDDYLTHTKKTRDQFALEIAPQAVERVKIGLLLREIVKTQNLKATDEEATKAAEEVAPGALSGTDWSNERKNELLEYSTTIAVNRKAIAWITDQVQSK